MGLHLHVSLTVGVVGGFMDTEQMHTDLILSNLHCTVYMWTHQFCGDVLCTKVQNARRVISIHAPLLVWTSCQLTIEIENCHALHVRDTYSALYVEYTTWMYVRACAATALVYRATRVPFVHWKLQNIGEESCICISRTRYFLSKFAIQKCRQPSMKETGRFNLCMNLKASKQTLNIHTHTHTQLKWVL